MTREDRIRELEKISDTLIHVENFLTKRDESNAALHMNDKVLYTPLTGAVMQSVGRIQLLIEEA